MFLRCVYPQQKIKNKQKQKITKNKQNKNKKLTNKQANKMPPLVVRVESKIQLSFGTERK